MVVYRLCCLYLFCRAACSLWARVSAGLSDCLSVVRLSAEIWLCAHVPFVCMVDCLSVCLRLFVCLLASVSACLSVSVRPSVRLAIHLPSTYLSASCPALSRCRVLSCTVPSRPAPPCPVPSCPLLSCPVLSFCLGQRVRPFDWAVGRSRSVCLDCLLAFRFVCVFLLVRQFARLRFCSCSCFCFCFCAGIVHVWYFCVLKLSLVV